MSVDPVRNLKYTFMYYMQNKVFVSDILSLIKYVRFSIEKMIKVEYYYSAACM